MRIGLPHRRHPRSLGFVLDCTNCQEDERVPFNGIDKVRRRVQNGTLGYRGRNGDPLRRPRRLLIAAHEHLSDRDDAKLRGLLAVGDPRGEACLAWNAKETLRGLYDIDCPQIVGAYLDELAANLTDTDCPPELRRRGRTLARRHSAIINCTAPASPTARGSREQSALRVFVG